MGDEELRALLGRVGSTAETLSDSSRDAMDEDMLAGRRSLKTPRGSKSIAGRYVAALDRFGGLACQTMEACPNVQRAGQVLPGCPDVGLMVIGDDGRRPGLGGRNHHA